jgi:hypothetical protein
MANPVPESCPSDFADARTFRSIKVMHGASPIYRVMHRASLRGSHSVGGEGVAKHREVDISSLTGAGHPRRFEISVTASSRALWTAVPLTVVFVT